VGFYCHQAGSEHLYTRNKERAELAVEDPLEDTFLAENPYRECCFEDWEFQIGEAVRAEQGFRQGDLRLYTYLDWTPKLPAILDDLVLGCLIKKKTIHSSV
jgi:hypothetical protein